MTTALLVIDMQQALCSGEEEAFDIKDVLKRVNVLIANAKIGGAHVIFIQHEEDEGSLVLGGDGWQLTQGLAAADGDIRVRKATPDAFHQTELNEVLERLEVIRPRRLRTADGFLRRHHGPAGPGPGLSRHPCGRCALDPRQRRAHRGPDHCPPQPHAQQYQRASALARG